MSRSTKVVVKRGTLFLGGTAVALTAISYVQTVVRIDPFAPLKKANKEIDPTIGIRLNGVHLQSFENGKLVTSASMERMDMRQDRNLYDLWNVHDGVFHSSKGTMDFSAPHAVWNVPVHELEAPNGAHVRDTNVDLNVGQFTFQAKSGEMVTKGPVSGQFYKGALKADGVRYNINSGTAMTGPIDWKGKLSLSQDPQDQEKPRTWNIHGETYHTNKDGSLGYYTKAIAKDGEIIVVADQVEHDRKTDIVTATGHVRYMSSKADMVCDKAVIDRSKKTAVMTGKVQMLVKSKETQEKAPAEDEGMPPYRPLVPEEVAKSRPQAPITGQSEAQKKLDEQIRNGKNVRDYPTICYAGKIEYWYKKGERHAIITEDPQARQELSEGRWRHMWTNRGLYDGEKDTLRMESSTGKQDTRFINSIGDDGVADWVVVSTKEDDETIDAANFTANLIDKSDEVPRDKPKPKAGDKKPGDKTDGTGTGTGTGTGGGTGGAGGAGGGLKGQAKKLGKG